MEKSKTYKTLGEIVGIEATKKSQRGIIARKALKLLNDYEIKEFRLKMPRITFN